MSVVPEDSEITVNPREMPPRGFCRWAAVTAAALLVLALLFATGTAGAEGTNAPPVSVCQVQAFRSPVLGQENAWHGIGVASDGNVYMGTSTHELDRSAHLLRFSPRDGRFEDLADLGEVTHTPVGPGGFVPQGKVHTPFFENDGVLHFATHVAVVSVAKTRERKPYPGGWFLGWNLKAGRCERLGRAPDGEGIITLVPDFPRKRLYGLTYPSALLLACDLASRQVRDLGTVGGEPQVAADQRPTRFCCRELGLDPVTGRVYACRGDGAIVAYDPQADRLEETGANVREGLAGPLASTADATWRSLRHDPESGRFYGTSSGGPWFFCFDPSVPSVKSLGRMAAEPFLSAEKPGGMASLAFERAGDGSFYQVTPGAVLPVAGRPALRKQAHLVSLDPRSGKLVDHGALCDGDRRVLSSESLAIAPEGTLWAMVYVESLDAGRPVGKEGVPYERALIRVGTSSLAPRQ